MLKNKMHCETNQDNYFDLILTRSNLNLKRQKNLILIDKMIKFSYSVLD